MARVGTRATEVSLRIAHYYSAIPIAYEKTHPMNNIHSDEFFTSGNDGVLSIVTPDDRKVDIVEFSDKRLCVVKSGMGYPAIYPLHDARFEPKAEAVLMDLDGTSVHSESFWMWVIEQTTARLLGKRDFRREPEDEPFISGHSVSEHLTYMIDKYCPGGSLAEARGHYFDIVRFEMAEIMAGRGRRDAFTPAPGLKEFLQTHKKEGIKIGLVTSGLYEKAMPEIVSAFRQLDLGDPAEFYDCIITAGQALKKGQTGTLGELEPKPHPWLYAETAAVGLNIPFERRHKVIGIEDSSAGVVSIRLAGYSCIGMKGGNIEQAGVAELCGHMVNGFDEILDIVL